MKNLIAGIIGTGLSAVGTAIQTSEVLQIISLVITIVGALISMILIPILSWYKKAKQDGKITIDEVIEGGETLQEGTNAVIDLIDKNKEKED